MLSPDGLRHCLLKRRENELEATHSHRGGGAKIAGGRTRAHLTRSRERVKASRTKRETPNISLILLFFIFFCGTSKDSLSHFQFTPIVYHIFARLVYTSTRKILKTCIYRWRAVLAPNLALVPCFIVTKTR